MNLRRMALLLALPLLVAAEPPNDPEQRPSLRLLADRAYALAADSLAGELNTTSDPDRAAVLLGLAQLRAGRFEEARRVLEPLRAKPGSAWQARALFLLAESHVLGHDFAKAAELYADAITRLISPERKAELAQTYISLAKKALAPDKPGVKPDPAHAASLYARALEFPLPAQQRETLLWARAEALVQSSAFAEAALAYGQIAKELPTGPRFSEASLAQALQTAASGDNPTARRLLQAFLGGKPSRELEGQARLALARTFFIDGQAASSRDLERGVSALRQFARDFPEDPQAPSALLQIGEAYAGAGRSEDAVAAFEELLRRLASRPELDAVAEARAEIVSLLIDQGKYEPAIEAARTYLHEHPAHHAWAETQQKMLDAELSRAEGMFEEKKWAEARTAYGLFLEAHPLDERNPDILFSIGESYAQEEEKKDKAEAISAWRRLSSKYPDSDAAARGAYRTGELLEEADKMPEALEAYEKVGGAWAGAAQTKIAAMREPLLTVRTQRSFRTNEGALLRLTLRNVPSLTLKAYRINLEDYFRKTHGTTGLESLDISLIDPDQTWTFETSRYQPLELREVDLPLPFKEAGVWLVHVENEKLEATTMVVISDLDLVIRAVGPDSLVLVQNPTTGEPIPGVDVLLSSATAIVAEGKTGADGAWLYRGEEDLPSDLRVFAKQGSSVAGTGLNSGSSDAAGEVESTAYLFTDRPLYKPGDVVQVKGFVRIADNGTLTTPAGRPARLLVYTPEGRPMAERNVNLGEWGNFETSVALPAEAGLGRYRLELSQEEASFEDGFDVEAYSLPKVLLEVKPDSATVTRGEAMSGVIRAMHAYGDPLIRTRVLYGLSGEPLEEGVTDEHGELRFSFPSAELGEDEEVSILAQLPAENLAASASVRIADAEFELSIQTSKELYLTEESFEVKIAAADWLGKPYSPEVSLDWLRIETDEAGVPHEVREGKGSVPRLKLDAAGKASHSLRVEFDEGGAWRVRVQALDSRGHLVSATRDLFISGAEDEQRLRFLQDSTEVQAGEHVTLPVMSRLEGPLLAALTFEGRGILSYSLHTIVPGKGKLEFEVDGAWAPNFAVQFSGMGRQSLYEARAEFSVRQGLTIRILPKSAESAPGTEVEAEIQTLDHLGRPVSAQVALGVVDQALLSMHPDERESISSAFYGDSRALSGAGSCSCSFSYTAVTRQVSEEIQNELKAAGKSKQREAELQRQEAVFAAGENMAVADEEADGRFGGLNVNMMAKSVAPRAAAAPMAEMAQGYAEGGVLGGAVGGMLADQVAPQPLVRKRFAETAFWGPSVVTDAQGRATVRFRLPDSTTSWHWLARGANTGLLFGEAEADTRTRLPVLAEVRLPDSLVEGDQAVGLASVHNLTGQPGSFQTRLAWRLADKPGAGSEATAALGPGEFSETPFSVEASVPGGLTVTWSADTDVVERSVPVSPWGVEEVARSSGIGVGERLVDISLPVAGLVHPRLRIEVSSRWSRLLEELWRGSPAWVDLRTRADLASDVLVAQAALSDAESRRQNELASELRGALELAAANLVAAQAADGGWAVAGAGASDPLLTAEALVALGRAKNSGFGEAVDDSLQKARGRIEQWFRELPEDQLEAKTAAVWALAETGPVDFAYLNRLYRSRNELSPLSLARLALAMHAAERADTAAELAGILASSKGQDPPYQAGAALADGLDPVVVSAYALRALALGGVTGPALEGLRDWLLSQRTGQGYGLRRRDAWAALAFEACAPLEEGRFQLRVSVNGQEVGAVDSQDPKPIQVSESLIRPGKNEVRFVQQGTGRYSYSVGLSAWNPQPRKRQERWVIQRNYEPAALVLDGQPVAKGYGILDGSYTEVKNNLRSVPSGGALEEVLSIYSNRAARPGLQSPLVVVEEPLPAGFMLDLDSLQGNHLSFEQRPGRLLFLFPRETSYYQLRFRLLARFSGSYGVLPTRVLVPEEAGAAEFGEPWRLAIQPAGAAAEEKFQRTPDEIFALGKWAFGRKDYAAARASLDSLTGRLRDEPARERAEMLLRCALAQGESREAIRHFEALKERWPQTLLTLAEMVQVSHAYRDLGEFERAYYVLRATAEGSFLADSQVSGTLEREGEVAASIEVLQSLLREYPSHPTMDGTAYGLAQLLVKQKLYGQALRQFQDFLVEHPDSPMADEVSFAWLSAELEAEDYPAAAVLAQRFQQRYPQSLFLPSYAYAEGYALFELRRYDEALAVLSKVASGTYKRRDGSMGPSENQDLALLLTGQIYQAKQELPKALELYDKVKEQFSEARELRDYYLRKTLSMPEVTTVQPGEPASLELTTCNLTSVQLLVYKVDLLLLYLREKNLNSLTKIQLTGIAPDHEATVAAGEGKDYRDKKLSVNLPLTEAGAYLVVARSGEADASGMVLLSELSLTAQEDKESGKVRLFLENSKTHEPVGRAHVKVVGSKDKVFQSGDTDLRGIFTADNVQGVVTAIARAGDQYAFFRGKTNLRPVSAERPVFDQKMKAMENLRRDSQILQQQRVDQLRGVQFNEAQGVEAKMAY